MVVMIIMVTLAVSRAGMVILVPTKIITMVTRLLLGVVMVYRKVVSIIITLVGVVTRAVTADTTCVTAGTINSSHITNNAGSKVISKIGISNHVPGTKMTIAAKAAMVILRIGSNKTDLTTATTITTSKTVMTLIISPGSKGLLIG